MKRSFATATLLLWITAFLSPLVGQTETSRSRFASLWTREAAFSESELLALSEDAEPVARQFAALQLAELDPPSEAALDALVQALGDPAEEVRWQALAGLMRIGRPATRVLVDALSDTKPIAEFTISSYYGHRSWNISRSDLAFAALTQVREVDVDVLLRSYPENLPELKEHGLNTSESSMKLVVLGSYPDLLGERNRRIRLVLKQTSSQLTPSIYGALQSDDAALRVTAALMIGRAWVDGAAAVPLLTKVIVEDDVAAVREAAAYALERIPGSGHQALYNLLKHTKPQTRSAALAVYLANAGISAKLIENLLKDPVREVRLTALERIGNIPPSHLRISGELDDPSLDLLIQSPSEPHDSLLARLPDSVTSEVLSLSRDIDASMRAAAAVALGRLGDARPEHASAVANALVAMLSDPVRDVVSAAVHQLAQLPELKNHRPSPVALGRLFDRLTELAREEGNPSSAAASAETARDIDEVLTILERMDLPENRRIESVEVLLDICLARTWRCRHVKTILARSSWLEVAAETLVARYPDLQTFDERALHVLEELGSGSLVYPKTLEWLLGHPEQALRVRAAIALAERGYTPTRVWEVLEEGARSSDDHLPWLAVRALASLGERGAERLIVIMEDHAADWSGRIWSISSLLEVDAKKSRAENFLLALAANPIDPDVQAPAVRALTFLESRKEDVRATLISAFSNGNEDVRSAVMYEWGELGLAPGDFVARVFADPSSKVRAAGVKLLSLLPEDDQRRHTFTEVALRDEDRDVQAKGLRFAGALDDAGEKMLAQYASRGGLLTWEFFSGVKRLRPFGPELVSALEARIDGGSAEECQLIIEILGRVVVDAPVNRERLYNFLSVADFVARERMSQTLLALQEDPWSRDGLLAAVLMEAQVRKSTEERLRPALEMLRRPDEAGAILHAMGPPRVFEVPQFPWPPPPGFSRIMVPHELLADSEAAVFGSVYKKLVGAIEAASDGFEHGVFPGPTDGFALVARMERIERDGTPLPEPARWVKEGSPKLSLEELLADLFFEKPGYFRVIVFAVTSDLAPGQSATAHLPEPDEGAAGMPRELAKRSFDGKEVLALVYSFERRRNAKITPWKDGAPSAKQHLERAGVWTALTAAASH